MTETMKVHIQLMLILGSLGLILWILFLSGWSLRDPHPWKRLIRKHKVLASGILMVIVSELLILLSFGGCMMLETQEWKYEKEPYKVEHIVSLKDNTQTNGQVFLRHEYVKNDMCYQYMVEHKDGSLSYSQVTEMNVIIYISDSNYRVESYKKQRHWLCFSEDETFYKIYVPKGCILEKPYLDLKME